MRRGELIARDYVVGDLLSRISALERRCARLEKALGRAGTDPGMTAYFEGETGILDATGGGILIPWADDNVTTPTDAEFDSAFGQPDALGDGWIALSDDNGSGPVRLVAAKNGAWWYETLTEAP